MLSELVKKNNKHGRMLNIDLRERAVETMLMIRVASATLVETAFSLDNIEVDETNGHTESCMHRRASERDNVKS